MVTAIQGPGTPEAAWLPWLAARDLPALPPDMPDRAVLVAPHPDDEVLGAGGLACLLAAAGVRVDVVVVTDGEASHPGSTRTAGLARRRAAESVAACARLGIAAPRRLALADGGGASLEDPVLAALDPAAGDWVIAVWEGDGHPDHEAVGRAAARAAQASGAQLVAYPIWAWHWAAPGDPRLPWQQARRVELPVAVHRTKARALAEFGSQLLPLGPDPQDAAVLPPAILARFTRPYEVVFTRPVEDAISRPVDVASPGPAK